MASKLPRLLYTVSKFALFLVSGFKDEKFIKKQTYVKTEISSKLILIIFSYTVSKLVHFFETQCIFM